MKQKQETALTKTTKKERTEGVTSTTNMSIYEYEQKYARRQNSKWAKTLITLFASVIGIFLFACLFLFSYRVWEINEYAGYVACGVSLILYVVFFIVPLVKILKSDYFMVNVNAQTARAAQRHNKQLRHDIAEKIIEFTASVDGVGWYDSYTVGQIAISLKTKDEEGLKKNLNDLYSGSVKKTARDIIFKSSLRSATFSAVSQTAVIDVIMVAVVNLQLIKDLIFLYGFRPSNPKLVRIFGRVLQNALTAYGVGNIQVGSVVVKSMGDVVKGIPLLGTAISTLIDSSIQGLTNGALTAVIGYQTIKYLNTEYRLQNILDGIELANDEDLKETCEELEKELKTNKKKYAPAV